MRAPRVINGCRTVSSREDVIDTERVTVTAAGATAATSARLAPGVELIGEYQGSGFQQPRYIARRADGQIIQLPRLLYLLAATLDGQKDPTQVAHALSAEFGRSVQPTQVSYMIDNRLRPAGLVAAGSRPADIDAGKKTNPQSDPLLALKFRLGIVPERVVWRIAGLFGPLFGPPVIAVALAAFVGLDVVIIARGGLGQIVPSTVALVNQPTLTLLVLAMVFAAAAFHECGHVSACRYGGARPGKMGLGLYLVWPALYSTVTDSYRLSRAGRLRTDLGGVYFNALFLAGMGAAYLTTGSPWLLAAIILLHLETATQFVPAIRLDGYYILSDLIGVPDLFSWMGPVLASMIPHRAPHPRVQQLKPWVRRTITLWIALVVPAMLYWVLGFVIIAPRVLPRGVAPVDRTDPRDIRGDLGGKYRPGHRGYSRHHSAAVTLDRIPVAAKHDHSLAGDSAIDFPINSLAPQPRHLCEGPHMSIPPRGNSTTRSAVVIPPAMTLLATTALLTGCLATLQTNTRESGTPSSCLTSDCHTTPGDTNPQTSNGGGNGGQGSNGGGNGDARGGDGAPGDG